MNKEQLKIKARGIVADIADASQDDLGFIDYLDTYERIIKLAEEYAQGIQYEAEQIIDNLTGMRHENE